MEHPQSAEAVVRAVHLVKIDRYSASYYRDSNYYVKSTCNVDGYDWEVRLYPSHADGSITNPKQVLFKLILLGEVHGEGGEIDVTANLSCRMVDPSGTLQPSAEKITATTSFRRPSDSSQSLRLMSMPEVLSSGFMQSDGSVTVECAVQVFRDRLKAIPVPSSDLPQHFGELLESHAGADVTFAVSGESFAAHKIILAARSPVFMAEFFGAMQEKTSGRVDIKEMEPSVFGAMLRFIYTDAVPEFEERTEAATTALAQHLLVAADRYRLDRLKVLCERRLAFAVDTATAAATLALAERHGCSQLKARCIEFIAGWSRRNLDAVMKTEGFKDLMVNSPPLLAELLIAAHGRKN